MLNSEIYNKLPSNNPLVNNGVVEVSEDYTESAQKVLRYELETFVCDGHYENGLKTILDQFLINLNLGTEQPGVWISGFYGSGKSHLAKMLRTLWTDFKFSDGATARGIANLPDRIKTPLVELSNQAKRFGGLHAAAGKLGAGAGANVRLALLGVVFKSKNLPEQINQAQFLMWLKQEGIFDALENELEQKGKSVSTELPHMYVSSVLATGLLKVRPGLANSEAEVRQLIKAQFPQVVDITNDQMIKAITDALTTNDRFPLTLVVLDEVQQYIGSDAEKAYKVQEITESLCKHFNGKLLFVGTGQSALTGTPSLQRIRGRFPVDVTLGDWDVENVTRKIILAKKPSLQKNIEEVWRDNLGEISRHLRGTKLEHVTEDEEYLTTDYPILPVRRRFWERVLRTIDTTGTVSQLRSQLRVIHEAVLSTANQPLGHVVSGDFLYDQIASSLVSTAQLPREIYETVARFADGKGTDPLKAQVLKLIFLINKLPAEAAFEIGLKATDDVLADLLVTNLKKGSSELRQQLPKLLDELQNKDRIIMAMAGSNGTEYRLQTRESSAWFEEFRAQEAELNGAPQRIEQQRVELFKARFAETLKKVRISQGKDNVERKLSVTYDSTLPKDSHKNIYLWIQDGWQSNEKSVIAEANAKSTDNPTLFAFLPAQHKTDIAAAIMTLEAARTTLQKKGIPSTEVGRDAQRSMESRARNAEKELQDLLDKLFATVRIFQAGGQEITEGADLADRINRAGKHSAIRLFNQFDVADNDKWGKVYDEARKGNTEALKAVGHTQAADKHPLCQNLLKFIGPGKKGSEIRDQFESPPFGWPRDAIDGGLFALLVVGNIRVTDSSNTLMTVQTLDRNKITQANFRQETISITPAQFIQIRMLFSQADVACTPKDELNKAPLLVAKLNELAKQAGGLAPAPQLTKYDALEALGQQSGNALLLELFSRFEELSKLIAEWKKTAEEIKKRLPLWNELSTLLEHVKELGPYIDLKAELDAIHNQRSLLADPDQVRPLLDRTTDILRTALNAKLETFKGAFTLQLEMLEADTDWNKLSDSQKNQLIAKHHLEPVQVPDLATPAQVQDALDECNLNQWSDKTDAFVSRFGAVRRAAVELLQPNVVHINIPRRTLKDEQELKEWLTQVENLISQNLKVGPVSI